jgi:hypothetical protein
MFTKEMNGFSRALMVASSLTKADRAIDTDPRSLWTEPHEE